MVIQNTTQFHSPFDTCSIKILHSASALSPPLHCRTQTLSTSSPVLGQKNFIIFLITLYLLSFSRKNWAPPQELEKEPEKDDIRHELLLVPVQYCY